MEMLSGHELISVALDFYFGSFTLFTEKNYDAILHT
jgi:hypothetical protein